MENLQEIKNEMRSIVTEMHANGYHNYYTKDRIQAAQAYALLVIAEKLDKKE